MVFRFFLVCCHTWDHRNLRSNISFIHLWLKHIWHHLQCIGHLKSSLLNPHSPLEIYPKVLFRKYNFILLSVKSMLALCLLSIFSIQLTLFISQALISWFYQKILKTKHLMFLKCITIDKNFCFISSRYFLIIELGHIFSAYVIFC